MSHPLECHPRVLTLFSSSSTPAPFFFLPWDGTEHTRTEQALAPLPAPPAAHTSQASPPRRVPLRPHASLRCSAPPPCSCSAPPPYSERSPAHLDLRRHAPPPPREPPLPTRPSPPMPPKLQTLLQTLGGLCRLGHVTMAPPRRSPPWLWLGIRVTRNFRVG